MMLCSNGNSAPALDQGFFPSAGIPGGPGFDVSIPRPPGCNPATFIGLEGGVLWTWEGGGNGVGGDSVDWSQSWINGYGFGRVELDPDDGISGLVTPVSSTATTTLSVVGKILTPTLGMFTVDWMGSNQGTAQRIRWYEYLGTIPPNFEGDNTELPNWVSLSTLLREEIRVGPWDESKMVFEISATNVNNIILATNGVAVSQIPEPSTLLLLISGLASLGFGHRKFI